jgi:hypothetical protein
MSEMHPVQIASNHRGKCSECNERYATGDTILASIRDGKVKKLVCSERCRLEFDNNFWQGVAFKNRNQKGRV